MAIVKVGSGQTRAGVNADGFTSGSFDTSGANFIIVNHAASSAGSETLTDSKLNTLFPLTISTISGKQTRLYYAYNATCGTGHTFSITGTDTFPALEILWFSGVLSTSDPFINQSTGQQNFASTVQAGSITPSEDNALVVFGMQRNQSATPSSINGGFTLEQEDLDTTFGHQGGAIAYLIQTTAAAANPTFTNGPGNATLCAAIASFKAAALAADLAALLGEPITGSSPISA